MENTKLNDRILWFDGVSEVLPDELAGMLLKGIPVSSLATTEVNGEVQRFNAMSPESISIKVTTNIPQLQWLLPEKYLTLNLKEYLAEKFLEKFQVEDELFEDRLDRLNNEIVEIDHRNLEMLFKTIIYVLDTFKEKQLVWGVGRGSSCACFILYILGLHMVDPIKYRISMTEFFHD